MLEVLGHLVAYVASFGILGGLVFAVVAAGARAKARQIAGWTRVSGQVVRAPRPPAAWGSLSGGLVYRYQLEGRSYEGGRITLLDWPCGLWPDAAARATRLAAGGPVEVFVNPRLADDAVLDPSPPPARAIRWGLVIALACVVLVLARRLF